jgi:hypothetical protein
VLFAVALVLLTYNPTGWSYTDWALRNPQQIDAVRALAGLLLLAGWIACLRAAWVALGMVGLVLAAALAATVIWLLVDFRLLSPDQPVAMQWAILIALGIVLGVGLAWSLLRQKATGQVEVS